jgi:hypothetical protein
VPWPAFEHLPVHAIAARVRARPELRRVIRVDRSSHSNQHHGPTTGLTDHVQDSISRVGRQHINFGPDFHDGRIRYVRSRRWVIGAHQSQPCPTGSELPLEAPI